MFLTILTSIIVSTVVWMTVFHYISIFRWVVGCIHRTKYGRYVDKYISIKRDIGNIYAHCNHQVSPLPGGNNKDKSRDDVIGNNILKPSSVFSKKDSTNNQILMFAEFLEETENSSGHKILFINYRNAFNLFFEH